MSRQVSHIEKILTLLESGKVDIEFERLRPGLWGGNDYEDEGDEEKDGFVLITISSRLCLNSKVRTLIHESLHLLYRSRNEKWVRNREDEVYASLTKLERQKLEAILQKFEKPHGKAGRFSMYGVVTSKSSHIQRILELLECGRVHVSVVPKSKLPKGSWGTCKASKRRIRIWEKLQLQAQIFTLVHECLHLLEPQRSEEWVRSRTYRVWGFITTEEYQKLEAFMRRAQ